MNAEKFMNEDLARYVILILVRNGKHAVSL